MEQITVHAFSSSNHTQIATTGTMAHFQIQNSCLKLFAPNLQKHGHGGFQGISRFEKF